MSTLKGRKDSETLSSLQTVQKWIRKRGVSPAFGERGQRKAEGDSEIPDGRRERKKKSVRSAWLTVKVELGEEGGSFIRRLIKKSKVHKRLILPLGEGRGKKGRGWRFL